MKATITEDINGIKYLRITTHEPVFKGLHRNSTTVGAYCPKCGEALKDYRQQTCTRCKWKIDWREDESRITR